MNILSVARTLIVISMIAFSGSISVVFGALKPNTESGQSQETVTQSSDSPNMSDPYANSEFGWILGGFAPNNPQIRTEDQEEAAKLIQAIEAGDYTTALQISMQFAADSDNSENHVLGQLIAGILYDRGYGVDPKPHLANFYWTPIAD